MHILFILSLWYAPWEPLPPLSDLQRLPDSEMCDNQLTFLAARRAWLDGQRGLFPDPMYAPWFEAATDDVESRRLPWTSLYKAHGWAAIRDGIHENDGDERREYPVESRRKMARRNLAELRRLLGALEYDSGRMPVAIGCAFWRRAD
jgi:hypothetical protein